MNKITLTLIIIGILGFTGFAIAQKKEEKIEDKETETAYLAAFTDRDRNSLDPRSERYNLLTCHPRKALLVGTIYNVDTPNAPLCNE